MENHIIVGLGGTGEKILRAFRIRLYQEYNQRERGNLPIKFVYVDSTKDEFAKKIKVQGQDASYNENEFVYIKGVDLSAVFEHPTDYPALKGFLGDPEVMRNTIGNIGEAAGQKRRAGRILFACSVQSYLNALSTQYQAAQNISGRAELNIHIFTGLAGGTGSGSIIDVIAQTRCKYPTGNIVVYCMIPQRDPGSKDVGRYHANAYAAFSELNALMINKYIPCDVTGNDKRVHLSAIPMVNEGKIVNGCFLFSNVNGSMRAFDPDRQLPTLVSDFLYYHIFLPSNIETTGEFIRTCKFENIDGFQYEFNEEAREGVIDPIRSKRFSTFGIKRVVIPEEEIIEFFTYSFGRQALLQMRYNNWNDDSGFQNAPANMDFHSFVRENAQLDRWRLTDKYLILDKPILTSDTAKKWPSFEDYWGSVIPIWADSAATNKMPLNELERLCVEGYENFFRKVGVKSFFESKLLAKDAHANEICTLIEKYLFDTWSVGDLSLSDLLKLIDCIIENVVDIRKRNSEKITSCDNKIQELEEKKTINQTNWSNKGVVSGWLSKNKLIQAHATTMRQLYTKKTEKEGRVFSDNMMAVLVTKLNELRGNINNFVLMVTASIEKTDDLIGSRCTDHGVIDIRESIVRFYDNDAVKNFTDRIVKDEQRQRNISDQLRTQLINRIGNDRSFGHAISKISVDVISDLLDTEIRQKSIAIHDEVLYNEHDKIIHRNILEQLNAKYPSETDLRAFAIAIIEQCSVFARFSDTEIHKTVPGNSSPIIGTSIQRQIVLVNLPSAQGTAAIQAFAGNFKNALMEAVNPAIQVFVDMSGSRQNEMTVASITYCFPLRALSIMDFLKGKYDRLVTGANCEENKIILHTEGTGEDFPPLFLVPAMSQSQIREKYLPYLLGSFIIGDLKYADRADGTGKKTYGTIEVDVFGNEVLKPLADRFVDIPKCEKFTKDFGEELQNKFLEALRDPARYLNIDKRKDLIDKVRELNRTIIIPECGGENMIGTPLYGYFRKAAEELIGIINQ